jgi:hypothetical protein
MRLSLTAAALLACAAASTATADLRLPRVSQNARLDQTIGVTDMSVTYSRPGVKGRVIWGGLVPYDQPWRTGANEATTFTTSTPIQFGGKPLAAGTYALLTIPGKDDWQVVLNSDKDMWGSNGYTPTKDVLRFAVKPTGAEPQEWMQFTFEDLSPGSANLVLRWEKLRVAVPITVDLDKIVADAGAAVDDGWRTPYRAASYCFDNNVSLDKGRAWLDQSIAMGQRYQNLNLLARWQMKDGKKNEAIATAKKAISAGKADKDKPDVAPTEKLLADWTAAK